MKNSLYKLWLLAAVLLLSGLPTLNLEARAPNTSNAETAKKMTFGGAYLQFAGKMGGEIGKDELGCNSELAVEGCARGSRIYQFTLNITRNGKTRAFQANSNQLTEEMVAALNGLSAGDEFEFQKVKAYLPNGKDSVDVHGRKFVVKAA